MITDKILREAIEKELDKAEAIWNEVGDQFMLNESSKYFSGGAISTKIPGFPFLVDGRPKVANFIALVLDIRNSTDHLTVAISEKKTEVNQLQRVLYETTAVYAAGVLIVEAKDGSITEFLGDGFLALFKIDNKDKEVIYNSYRVANKCIQTVQNVVNSILLERYNLPPLDIGIGLAYSKAIVTLVGTKENFHAKALGECVFRATKLSESRNEIYIDNALRLIWPKKKGGKLRFSKLLNFEKFDAFKLTKNK